MEINLTYMVPHICINPLHNICARIQVSHHPKDFFRFFPTTTGLDSSPSTVFGEWSLPLPFTGVPFGVSDGVGIDFFIIVVEAEAFRWLPLCWNSSIEGWAGVLVSELWGAMSGILRHGRIWDMKGICTSMEGTRLSQRAIKFPRWESTSYEFRLCPNCSCECILVLFVFR